MTTNGQPATVLFPLTYAVTFAGTKHVKLAATGAARLSAGQPAMGVDRAGHDGAGD